MLEAWVMVCLLSNPTVCFEAVDTRGPYKTREQCVERVEEMTRQITTIPNHKAVAFKCAEVKGKLGI